MNLKPLIIILYLILSQLLLVAQDKYVDSLENLVENYKNDDTIKVNLLNRVAFQLYTRSIEKTLEFAQRSLTLSKDLGYLKGEAESLKQIGIYYSQTANYPKALEYQHQALTLFERIGDILGTSMCYNNMGLIYWRLGEYDKALEYYLKALELRLSIGDSNTVIIYYNISLIYYSKGEYQKSLDFFELTLTQTDDSNGGIGLAFCNVGIGNVYLAMQEYTKAEEFFNKALEISKRNGSKLIEAWSSSGLGAVYYQYNHFQKAYNYSVKAHKLALEINNIERRKESSEIAAKSLAALGRYKEAYNYHLIFKSMSDSLVSEKNFKKIVANDYQYKLDKEMQAQELEKQKQQELHRAELARQATVRNSFIIAFALMLLLAFFIYLSYHTKKKANFVLAQQKQEIENKNKQLTELNAEINSQAEELLSKNNKLIELDRFKEGMMGMIVHDLKNPLNTILNLSKETETRQAGNQMLNLIMNILDVQKFESAQMVIQQSEISLQSVIIDALHQVKILYERKSILIKNSIQTEVSIKGDIIIITRVFVNLLTNAIKYSPNNGQIVIDHSFELTRDGYLRISIIDGGTGIPQDKLGVVFEKFAQVESKSSGSIRSTGLGLTFCKLAIEAHGGEIGVDSVLGKGSTFWFDLPVASSSATNSITNTTLSIKDTKYKLNSNDILYLNEFVKDLAKHSVYEFSDVYGIISRIQSKNDSVVKWRSELEDALKSCNESIYNELIKLNGYNT